MASAHFLERVAERIQKIGIGREHRAIERELQHRLRLADGGELAEPVGALEHLVRHVDRVLDDFARLSEAVENGVVSGLHPQRLAILALALVLRGLRFAPAQLRPELLVLRRIALVRVDEHAVMLPANLRELVAGRLEELPVRMEHVAIHVEMDDRRHTPDRRNVPLQVAHARDQRSERSPGPCQRIVRHINQAPQTTARADLVACAPYTKGYRPSGAPLDGTQVPICPLMHTAKGRRGAPRPQSARSVTRLAQRALATKCCGA